MGKKHKNKVRVLPGRMYRLVRSDRSVYCDAENALRTCFIEETKERRTAREEGELCRFVRMAPDGGVELISNAGNVVRFKNAEDLTKTLRFAKDVLRITEVLKMGIKIELTDDEIIEPSGGIVMFNLPGGEFPGNEDVLFDLRWSVIPRREGGIEVFGGNDGKIVLESEEEVKDLCEAMIRQIRAKPIFSDSGEPLLDCQSERRAAEPDLREGGQSEDQN